MLRHLLFLIGFLWILTAGARAQAGIVWYGTWEQGYRAAQASGKPIMLLAAAPQCKGVSGIW